jgi:NADPH:quinone reductase-like Zn-dependent oxidoreductase
MQLLPFTFRSTPAIPEMDFSGIVVSSSCDLKPGTQVFGSIPLSQHVKTTSGTLAEYVAVPQTAVVPKPDSISMEEAAGLGIAGATALQLLKAARLKTGDSVLVNGASGGIGHLVLQMCCHTVGPTGRVKAICSSRNAEWVEKLGENVQVIAHDTHGPIHSYLNKTFAEARFDAVVDAVGIQDIFNNSPTFLKEGRPYVTVGPKASSYTYSGMLGTIGTMTKNILWPRWLGGTPRPYVQVAAASDSEALKELARMVTEVGLRTHVGTEVHIEDVHKVSLLLFTIALRILTVAYRRMSIY